MKIAYLGEDKFSSTSYHRATALTRIGNSVKIFNPYKVVSGILKNKLFNILHYRTGYKYVQHNILVWLEDVFNELKDADLIWVDSGELIGDSALRLLHEIGCPIVLYNVDDPTGMRDGNRFKTLLKAMPMYDLAVVVRPESEIECRQLGVKKVLKVYRSYDEVAHLSYLNVNDIPEKLRSEVAFIGTWMRHENRDTFLLKLIEAGVPLSIWGDRWHKSRIWNKLSPYYRGSAIGGRDYVGAIQGAKLVLGLLSKGNRDLHTQRSLEVPFAGGLLCAERTTEHQEMYKEGVEAVFWADAEECAAKCKELLDNDQMRERIKAAGMRKVRELSVGNEDICRKVLSTIS